jgi:hypothetical protein
MTTPDFPDAMARLLATAAEDGFDVGLGLVHSDLSPEPVEIPMIRTPRGLYALQAVEGAVVAEEVIRLASPVPSFAGGPPFVLQADANEPAPGVLRRLLDAIRLPGYAEGARDVRLDGTLGLAFMEER